MRRKLCILTYCLHCAVIALAVPAMPGWHTFIQKDGKYVIADSDDEGASTTTERVWIIIGRNICTILCVLIYFRKAAAILKSITTYLFHGI